MLLSKLNNIHYDKSLLQATLLRLLNGQHDNVIFDIFRKFNQTGRSYQLLSIPRALASTSQVWRYAINKII